LKTTLPPIQQSTAFSVLKPADTIVERIIKEEGFYAREDLWF